MTTAKTREEWLNEAAQHLNEMIEEKTSLTPAKKILVSAGWPRRGGRVIGQCSPNTRGGKVNHVFISPVLGTATEVLHVLLHELIHAADNCGADRKGNAHAGAFLKAVRAVGLEGKPTATVPGKALRAELKTLAGTLGSYPHSKYLDGAEISKQSTRMLKVECEECGCVVRMTRKWLDVAGTPTCACGTKMMEA